MSLNLILAVALLVPTALVTVLAERVRHHFDAFDDLRTVVVAIAIALAPVNLVFAITGNMGIFNGIILTVSLIGFCFQCMLLLRHHRRFDDEQDADWIFRPRRAAEEPDSTPSPFSQPGH